MTKTIRSSSSLSTIGSFTGNARSGNTRWTPLVSRTLGTRGRIIELANVVHPRAGRIYKMPRANFELALIDDVEHTRGFDAIAHF